jgi:putative oxidoreductase
VNENKTLFKNAHSGSKPSTWPVLVRDSDQRGPGLAGSGSLALPAARGTVVAIDREQDMQQIRDLMALIGRIGLGIIFIAHGNQKLTQQGVDGTSAGFAQLGIPFPTLSAWYATLVELVGGIALIIGFALPVFGVLLALNMVGALIFVHLGNGFFAMSNGYEYVLALAVASLAIGFNGGAFALDRVLFRNRTGAARPAPV